MGPKAGRAAVLLVDHVLPLVVPPIRQLARSGGGGGGSPRRVRGACAAVAGGSGAAGGEAASPESAGSDAGGGDHAAAPPYGYRVEGAGSAEADGLYVREGEYAGAPLFKKGRLWLLRYRLRSGNAWWYIADRDNLDKDDGDLYRVKCDLAPISRRSPTHHFGRPDLPPDLPAGAPPRTRRRSRPLAVAG